MFGAKKKKKYSTSCGRKGSVRYPRLPGGPAGGWHPRNAYKPWR